MSKPKITLITCTYYRPDLLRRTIQSVQQQTLQDYEHIIVSDHCPFARHVYDDFKTDTRIKFIENLSPHIYNLGAVSFNIGIENAKTNCISYVLDDDILYPNHLQEHYDGLKNNDVYHTSFDNIEFKEPNNTVKNIVSMSYSDICKQALIIRKRDGLLPHNFDVGALCHKKDLHNLNWIPQCELSVGWEDSVFIGNLGIDSKNTTYTSIKINWGGIHRKNTKGLDQEYYNKLMKKLDIDNNSYTGYRLIDQPYVYPELKDTLYGK